MGWFWKLIAFFCLRAPEQIAVRGAMLSPEEAERLEARLRKRPGDLRSRYKVLGYSTQRRFMDPGLARRRAEHVLWMIEHHPELEFSGSPFCHVLQQEPGSDRVRAAWENAVAAPGVSAAVLQNAARAYAVDDQAWSRSLLERGERLEPASPDWAEEMGHDLFREVSAALHFGPGKEDGKDFPAISQRALVHFERALKLATEDVRRFHLLTDCAKAALEAGLRAEAVQYAEASLALAPRCGGDRHRPDVIHAAHVVRGRARLESGDPDGAARDLEDAGRQGSLEAPVLRSFGPDFVLAALLLEAGRKDAVLAYLARCETFWNPKRCARWRAVIEKGGHPRMSTGFDPAEPRDEQGPYWVDDLLKPKK